MAIRPILPRIAPVWVQSLARMTATALRVTERHATKFLGIFTILLVWFSTYQNLQDDFRQTERATHQIASNLALAVEEHIVRSIRAADQLLLYVREAYQQDPAGFDLSRWGQDKIFSLDIVDQVGIVDRRGFLIGTSRQPVIAPVDLNDREHIRVHQHSGKDELFIGKPVVLRSNGKWSIQLTRPILTRDGQFDGAFTAALDPEYLSRFYQSIDVGARGSITLIGTDGVIRARASQSGSAGTGGAVAGSTLFEQLKKSKSGVYVARSAVDGVVRYFGFRQVPGLPLVVLVGIAADEAFAGYYSSRADRITIAFVVTLVLLLAVWFTVRFQAGLQRKSAQLETTLANMSQGLCMFDAAQRVVISNERYARLYGLTPDQVRPGTYLAEIVERRIERGIFAYSSPTEYKNERLAPVRTASYQVQHLSDGRAIAISRQPMEGGGWVTTHTDITEQQRIEARIDHLARHDSLTDLGNRHLFQEEIAKALGRIRENEQFAILLLDLDHFKDVNDTLGHPVGDSLLVAVSDRLRQCVSAGDVVARLGGDEFAVIQSVSADAEQQAIILARRISESVGASYELNGQTVEIATSIGVVLAPLHGSEADELLKKADLALYKAKSEGRGGFEFFDPELDVALRARCQLESDLKAAVARREFAIHYQPIVSLGSRQTCCMEALVRWHHPVRGLLPPANFIDCAEDIGLIIPIGENVLAQACRDAANWPSHVNIAVNLSPLHFRKSNLVEVVRNALDQASLNPARLELEITETVLFHRNDQNLAILRQLQDLGVSIVLDDFGTGYSSLSYLRLFPFNKLKIDKCFVSELATREDCGAIVSAIAGLGRSLGIATVAEGVETEDQLKLVRAAGCTHAQGYLFGRPADVSVLDLDKLRRERELSYA